MNIKREFIAELLGTFNLIFIGCGAIVVHNLHPGVIGHGGVAAAFGLIVMIMIYSVGNISGAHLNPAVTLGFYLAKKISFKTVLPYMLSQFLGSITASVLLKILFPEQADLGTTLPKTNLLSSFILEVLLTALLMFVILNVSTGHMEKGIMAGVAVGGTVLLAALVFGPLTGASMNPARSLGPALLSLHFEHLWIYLSAPFLGAILAYPSCRLVQGEECCTVKAEKK